MIGIFLAELTKIRRSLLWFVILAVPLLVGGVTYLVTSNIDQRLTWLLLVDGVSGGWYGFLLPMTVTIVTALQGQLEHRHNTWSYMLSLPAPKWSVFFVKGLTAAGIMALISLMVVLAMVAGAVIGGTVNPEGAIYGPPDWALFKREFSRVWIASGMLVVIQFWVAMRFGGLALPLLVGIGGGLFSVVAAATSTFGLDVFNADYLPWLLPSAASSAAAAERGFALWLGGAGGLGLLVVVSVLLARKDWN